MPSLTPAERSDEVTWDATRDGLISGALAFVPSAGAVWLAMKNPRFVKATNWQSRTALVVMPTLFMYGFAAESKLVHRMHEVAQETEHAHQSVEWAERHHQASKENEVLAVETDKELTKLYRQSVAESGVRVVPGDTLGIHHRMANYWQENPFKILAMMGVPTVGYIFWGRSGKQHLQLQMQVMHTRVMGQFAVISMLLGLMGFKEYMDKCGKFITESEASARVDEMHRVRQSLMVRLDREKKMKEAIDEEIHKAHDKDVKEGQVHYKNKHDKNATHMGDPQLAAVSAK